MSFSQDNMKNLPNKSGPENFLYYIVSWWKNYFKLWLRKEQFYVVEKWHFVQNRFLFFVSLLSSLFFFFSHWQKWLLPTATHKFRDSFEWTRTRKAHKTKQNLWKVAFLMYKYLGLWVRWLNKVFYFKAS